MILFLQRIIFSAKPESHIHQCDQCRYFYQRADHAGKSLPAVDAKYADGYGDGQFKIITGSGESNGSIGWIIGSHFFADKKTDQEHDGKIDHQGQSNAQYIKRDLYDQFAL